ncbi:sigma-70 family RNA polymerase sigma factor [Paenibacillus lycopersici]|uniref:Sigma-70 family RNA polymerase sigma factor n=1 Tax=Paenibacillus lycopersici TaxID=2704462 RepID=A0A6C0FWC1_9BACL|nr:RNA polymerase sigma factor SigJ [Paenibacillus lycopersici]QHT61017.1 sigma-70 family RNA polymerase sigma factor [Paenibacillus lycopersici]
MQELYEQYKGLLFKLAYQLTGSVSDAEDAVQDVFLKIYDVLPEKLAEPKAYLCKMITNRCRDLRKAARNKREQYFGEWLPEPYSNPEDSLESSVIRDDLLSYGTLVLLERLSTTERMVFVLREAFGFEYAELAKIVDKTETNCRKLYSRAKSKMGIDSEETVHADEASEAWISGFLAAIKQGNVNQVLSMLDEAVVLVSDGGGKVRAAVEPIVTRARVAEFLLGPVRRLAAADGEPIFDIAPVNGQPALILRSEDGIHTVGLFHVEGNSIRNLYFVRNPDKLGHVGK